MALALVGAAPQAAVAQPQREPPRIDARAWILVDPRDGEALARGNPGRRLPIASATKLMTAHLALRGLRPNQRLRAPAYDAAAVESQIGLRAGESMSVRDLLHALLLESANDAAAALAEGVAGGRDPFVAEMNRAAEAMGLEDTRFANPIGLDERGNYSSARDLATLATRLLQRPLFARIVAKPRVTLTTGASRRRITTRNLLVQRRAFVTGVKTGQTQNARHVLVGSARRDGTTLISVVLGARSEAARDAETLKLLRYGFSLYAPRTPVRRGEELAAPSLDYRDDRLSLVAGRPVRVGVRQGQSVTTAVEAPGEVSGPVEEGESLGRVVVIVDGREAGTSPLVAAKAAPAASLSDKALHYALSPVLLLPVGAFVIVVGLLLVSRGRRRHEARSIEERIRMREERMRKREENRVGEGPP